MSSRSSGQGQQREDPEEITPQLEYVPCHDAPVHPAQISAIYEEEDAAEAERTKKTRPEIIDNDNDPPVPLSYIADDGTSKKRPPPEADQGGLDFGAVDDDAPISPHQFAEVGGHRKGREETPNSPTNTTRATATAIFRIASPINRNRASRSRAIRPPPPSMVAPLNREPSESNTPMFHEVEATVVQGVEATLIRDEPSLPIYNAVFVENIGMLPWYKRHQKWVTSGLILIIGALVGIIVAITLNFRSQGEDGNVKNAQIEASLPTPNPSRYPTPMATTVRLNLCSFHVI